MPWLGVLFLASLISHNIINLSQNNVHSLFFLKLNEHDIPVHSILLGTSLESRCENVTY